MYSTGINFSSLVNYRSKQSGTSTSMDFLLIAFFPQLGLNAEIYSANLFESPKPICSQCTLSLSPENIRKPSEGRERVHWDQMG